MATVKRATDHVTLGTCMSMLCPQHFWENGQWRFDMEIDWRVDRSSVVKNVIGDLDGERWIIKTFVEIYLWSAVGLTKIASVYLEPLPTLLPTLHANFILDAYIGEHKHIYVGLSPANVAFGIDDVEADWWTEYIDTDATFVDGYDQKVSEHVAIVSNKTSNFLQHEPVFKVIHDYVLETGVVRSVDS